MPITTQRKRKEAATVKWKWRPPERVLHIDLDQGEFLGMCRTLAVQKCSCDFYHDLRNVCSSLRQDALE